MKDLIAAMAEEKSYLNDRANDIETVLSERLALYGYSNLTEYSQDQRNYLFNNWIPEIYPIDVRDITTDLEYAVKNALIEKGISADKLKIVARGKRALQIKEAQNEDQHAQNRRVEVRIINPENK